MRVINKGKGSQLAGWLMMKKQIRQMITCTVLSLIVLCLFCSGASAGEPGNLPLAPRLRMELSQHGLAPGQTGASPGGTRPKSALKTISVLIHHTSKADGTLKRWIETRGGTVRVHTDVTSTALLTMDQIISLATQPSVRYLSLPSKVHPLLNASVPEIRADQITAPPSGSVLPGAYTGQDVIVGVVDTGIDWRHEDFVTDDGTSRILCLWDQTDNRGPSPGSPFTYGTEYSQETISRALSGSGSVYEKDTHGHGTHVTGIAASNGLAEGGYAGVAPEADLIIVKCTFWVDDVETGIDYIARKAQALGKPCVINLSLGTHYGPHDGSSHFCQTLDQVSGQGVVIVVAAGNEGSAVNHLGYAASSTERDSPFYFNNGVRDGYVDIWYDQGSEVDFKVQAFNLTGTKLADTGWVPPGSTITRDIQSAVTTFGDVEVDATETQNPMNNARHVVIHANRARKGDIDESAIRFLLHTRGSGSFDAWIDGGYFSTSTHGTEFSGNSEKTVGLPGTSSRAITVANYVTKNSWTNYSGGTRTHWESLGALTTSSSKGPSRREDLTGLKPELAAPGTYIASALSDNSSTSSSNKTPDGKHFLIHGTSMAAPHVTGTIALMLQAQPELTPEEVETYLTGQARQDDQVGDTIPNYSWGYGKLDSLGSMLALLGLEEPEEPPEPPPQAPTPTGVITLLADPDSLTADGQSESVVTSNVVRNTAGSTVEEGTLFTVTLTEGPGLLRLTGDDNTDTRIQAESQQGRFSFVYRSTLIPGPAVITAASYLGDAAGGITIETIGYPEIDILGNGVSITTGDSTPDTADHTDFGNVYIDGNAGIRTFTIENSGNANLILTGDPLIDISGPHAGDYSLDLFPGSPVAAGGQTSFRISFEPTAPDSRQATVTIYNSDSDESTFTFSIQGTGVVKTYTISGDILLQNGSGVEGVQVSLGEETEEPAGTASVQSATTSTGSDGAYSADGFPDGVYPVTPSKNGYVFEPASAQVVVDGDHAVQDFTGFGLPAASADASPLSGTVPLKVSFSGTGTDPENTLAIYEWDVDGNGIYDWESETHGTTAHTYTRPGTYEAVFRIIDSDNFLDTAMVTIQANPSQNPTAEITATPATGTAPLEVELSGSGSDPDGTISSYSWDFEGDGWYDYRSISVTRLSHVYRVPGIYQPTLQVTDNAGLTAVAFVTIAIDPPEDGPGVTLTSDLETAEEYAPLTVEFTVTTEDFRGAITRLTWDFNGDGALDQVSLSPDPVSHTYGQVGTFMVRVEVTDSTGASAADQTTVEVRPNDTLSPPDVQISNDYLTGSVPFEASLSAAVSDTDGRVVSVTWDFDGDGKNDYSVADSQGDLSGTVSASHTYREPGNYRVRCTAVDDEELIGTGLIEVFVREPEAFSVWITQPGAGRKISGSAVTLSALTTSDADTVSVEFMYRPLGEADWDSIEIAADGSPYAVSWDTLPLSPEVFELRARALDINDSLIWSDIVGFTIDHLTPESRESTVGDDGIVREETVSPEEHTEIILAEGTGVFIPFDLLDESTSIIIGVLGDSPPQNVRDASKVTLVRTGAYREFSLESGQDSFTNDVTLTFPYDDRDNDGVVDDTDVEEHNLAVYWYDESASPPAWKKEQSTLVFPDDNYVKAMVNHFSVFILGESAETWGSSTGSVSSGGGGCFIATAACGSPDDGTIVEFREFRDRHLLTDPLGTLAVDLYYQLSPPLAVLVANHPPLRLAARLLLHRLSVYLDE